MSSGEILVAVLLVILTLLFGTTLPWVIKMYGRIIALESSNQFLRERVEILCDKFDKHATKIERELNRHG